MTVCSIVFVHGFTGHPVDTWKHKGNGQDETGEPPSKIRKVISSTISGNRKHVYWPQDLLPITAPNARILTYGYDTHISHPLGPTRSKSTVYDIAWDFLVSLESERNSEPARPLLFIAHSLGGIIIKEALRRSHGSVLYQDTLRPRNIYESTAGIFFFGTPHGGADPRGVLQHVAEKIITVVGRFSANKQVVDTLLPSSERLRELRDEFGPIARQNKWIIFSFQEEHGVLALSGKKVILSSCVILSRY
jgi:hypothetical protein